MPQSEAPRAARSRYHEIETQQRADICQVVVASIEAVCSDGNSDPTRVAHGILTALKRAGYQVVKITKTDAPPFAAPDE